jgi:hypothetical protein
MERIAPGDAIPAVPGSPKGPGAVVFYKVTCPTCQVAAPAMERLHEAFPGRVAFVGQDPAERLRWFAGEFATSFPTASDAPPYDVSNAYGVRTVPTMFVTDGERVVDVVESWDREGWNRAARRLADLTGDGTPVLSTEGDGLPPFRPG